MRVLAVSVRYPTAMQTWFINYLESIEEGGCTAKVLSMEPGSAEYHPKVDLLSCQTILTYRGGIIVDIFRSSIFVLFSGKYRAALSVLRNLRKEGLSWKEVLHGFRGLYLYPKAEADIIHCHSEKAAFRALPLLLLSERPIVLTFHGLPPQEVPDVQPRQRKILAKYIDRLLVNTKFASHQYSGLVSHNLPVTLIKQGINLNDFPFSPRKFPRLSSPVSILTVGRIDRLKGHKLVIDAIVRLSNKRYSLNYTIVGSGYYVSELQRYVSNLGLDGLVSINPPEMGEALTRYFRSHDIFVLPSFTEDGQWAETQGIVIQEAQACGLPVIASDSGGIPECVNPDEDTLVFKQGSSEDLSEKLETLLSSEALWNNLIKTGRDNVEKYYSLGFMGDKLLEVYESVLDSSSLGSH